jgi:NADH-quinone oxidoreductase subunit F
VSGHLSPEVVERAHELVALYPHSRSALIPVCHLAQEQDGWLRPEAIAEIAQIVGLQPAEVIGTASFYEMLRTEPVGIYVISVCTNIACMLRGAYELLDHAQEALGTRPGSTTADGMFTLEDVECIADCGRAPCLAVNHRFFGNVTDETFDVLVDDLRADRLSGDVPPHGTLLRVRREGRLRVDEDAISAGRRAAAPSAAPRAGARRSAPEAVAGGGRPVAGTEALRILTSRLDYDDSHTLERYLESGGYEGLRKALSMAPEEVAAAVEAISLLGRGGAGFPAGRKWSMLRKASTTYLVVNGDESEPATFKDHLLLERDPHQLVEGAVICAYAIGAARVFVYVRGEFALGLERVQKAVNEAYAYGALGRDIFGSGFSLDVVVHPGAGAYICGEETALLESLEGKRGFPRIKPPYFPASIGVYGEPTVVNNVETLSNLPWVLVHGSEAYTSLGEGRSTGTRLFALSGHVRRPGVYEVEMVKTTFRDLIYAPALGGGIPGDRELKAFIPGGASAPWFGPEQLDLPLGQDEVAAQGSMLGSGSVVVMDSSTCAVRAAWRITRFFWRESCGQCTPCREGSGWLEKVLRRIEDGRGREGDLDLLMDVCDNLAPGVSWPPQQTTICVLGSSIPSSIASGIRMFRDEFEVHIKDGRCPFG